MNKLSTWLYIAAGFSLILLHVAYIWTRRVNPDPAVADRIGIYIGLWIPTLLIVGKILEDRKK